MGKYNVKVALIGYGHLGKWHAQKAEALANLVAIVDVNESSLNAAKNAHPNVKTVTSLDLIDNEIDAVIIVSPTKYHFDICLDALKRGKHVFCEKPVTETSKQALELKKLLEDNKNLVFQVGHSERCHQAWEIISDQTIVKNARAVHIKRVSPFKGRAADVSVVEDLMIHDMDLALMFYGEPSKIDAIGTVSVTDKTDYAKATLTYEDREVVIEDSRCDVEVERSIHFRSNEGEIKVDLFSNKIITAKGFLDNGEQNIQEVEYEKRDHLFIEQEYFYNSITDNRKVFVTLEDGINAIKALEIVNAEVAK